MSDNQYELSKTDPKLLQLLGTGGSISFKAFEEDILALSSIVAGTSYQNLEKIEEKIILNETKLQLKREPQNEYDEFAILVLMGDKKLGYIPKAKNQTIARLMDAGKAFYAKAVSKEWEGKWLRIDIEVFLVD